MYLLSCVVILSSFFFFLFQFFFYVKATNLFFFNIVEWCRYLLPTVYLFEKACDDHFSHAYMLTYTCMSISTHPTFSSRQVHRNKDGSITLKLADFGLAMEVKELIYTVCGTPTYVAPEILTEIGVYTATSFFK